MNRRTAVAIVLASMVLAAAMTGSAQAPAGQRGGAPAGAGQAGAARGGGGGGQQDMSNVQIKTTKISGNFYTLEGNGGTIGVLPGPDGVLMVDSQFAPLTEKIVAAIK